MAGLAERGCVAGRELDRDRGAVAAGPSRGRGRGRGFPAWWSAQQVFAAAASANAAIVRMTAIPSLLVVRPDEHDGLTRLRGAGVWLAMDPQAIAACLTR